MLPLKVKLTICFLLLNAFAWAQVESYIVYSEGFEHGIPAGVMGAEDGRGFTSLPNCDQNPYAGKFCYKVKNDGSEAWNGIYVFASGIWRAQSNDIKVFAQLKGYNYFQFYARADQNVTVKAGFGEGEDDSFAINNLELSTTWKKYTYYIGDVDMKTLNGLFMVTLDKPCSIYFDNIVFLKGNKKEVKKYEVPLADNRPAFSAPKEPVKVEMVNTNGQWQLMRNGEPYFIKGAGGTVFMDRVKAYGGNSVRTWGDDNAGAILDSAYKYGLTVMLGLWLGHERHGFDYDNKEAVKMQTLRFKETVLKYKDHPALLLWGIGNEVDLFYTNTNVWYAVQEIAKMVHELDPNHPTSTVTAGLDTLETRLIMERCPDIDIYGVNTYGDIGGVRD
ncbi:MAG: hypothetical protein K2Q22_00035, partial [Cytophagales bacterium]|nr:hypothetical protein [Cytophagales bacterium]